MQAEETGTQVGEKGDGLLDGEGLSGSLYVRTSWYRDPEDGGLWWCEASMMLNGAVVCRRSARQMKSGEMRNSDIVRRTAISLCKHEFCRTIRDFRGAAHPFAPNDALGA